MPGHSSKSNRSISSITRLLLHMCQAPTAKAIGANGASAASPGFCFICARPSSKSNRSISRISRPLLHMCQAQTARANGASAASPGFRFICARPQQQEQSEHQQHQQASASYLPGPSSRSNRSISSITRLLLHMCQAPTAREIGANGASAASPGFCFMCARPQ